MRRDYPLLTSYRFQDALPLDCPVTAFAARQDDMVYTDEIREWARHTRGGFELMEIDGDHWFLNRNRPLITATLSKIAAGVARKEAHDILPAASTGSPP
jgi:surfactin synthase thioesterase subunit